MKALTKTLNQIAMSCCHYTALRMRFRAVVMAGTTKRESSLRNPCGKEEE